MRASWVVTVLAVACSSNNKPGQVARPSPTPAPSPSPTPVPSPKPTPTPPAVADAVDPGLPSDIDTIPLAAGEAHECKRRLLEPGSYHNEMGGRTIDQLGEDAAKQHPIAGTCDTRLRAKLETTIAHEPATARRGRDAAWDHKSALGYHDLVAAALALTPADEAQLARDGFAVPARLAYEDYASAYYDVHRAQLPVYVSADSILHAIYASHDQLLARLERDQLVYKLDDALGRMHCALAIAAKDYPAETVEDLDLYLTVGRRLLGWEDAPDERGTGARAAALVARITAAGPLEKITLFGRERAFDTSAYMPRGHYGSDSVLQSYFRAAMWLSRLELNVASRDTRSSSPGYDPDPRETPREAVLALALADLAERSGALADFDDIERAWAGFAGGREDISLRELAALRKRANIKKLAIPASADALRAAIGDRYKRTVNTAPNPNVPNLPAIATAVGPRITPDTVALATVAAATHNDRGEDGPHDMTAALGYALGHDRALAYATPHIDHAAVVAARDAMKRAPIKDDLYGAWYDAIRALADRPDGALPSFMATPAFQDLRLATALAAYGQLRHNHVLIAAQLYEQGGCEIPDGYVEPVPHVYAALAKWARRGETTYAALDPKDATGGRAYYKRAAGVLDALAAIARRELSGAPLSNDDKRFLAMIVEMRIGSTTNGYSATTRPIPTYDGWYLDLFPNNDTAFTSTAFIADYATHDWHGDQWVDYLGAKGPHLGLFVVDVGGKPRLMVGPVAQPFAAHGPVANRFSDQTMNAATAEMPWAASYTIAAPAEPTLTLAMTAKRHDQLVKNQFRGNNTSPGVRDALEITAPEALGGITIELRDHHFVKIRSIDVRVAAGSTKLELGDTTGVESLLVRRGEWTGRADIDVAGHLAHQFGAPPAQP